MLYSSFADIRFVLSDVPSQRLPQNILMVRPDYYQVEYSINPHMEGNVGTVDPANAFAQWDNLRRSYLALGYSVKEMGGVRGFPDMVFSANQTLPGVDSVGRKRVVMSNMATGARSKEVAHFRDFFTDGGYDVVNLDSNSKFEGCGDGIWHHDLRLLWCGYGFRSDPAAFEEACEVFDVSGILLELLKEEFYHLDTCLSILNRDTALWVPAAFSSESAEMIERLIPRLLEVPLHEARSLFACNAHSPDGNVVLIQTGCDETNALLRSAGFRVVEIETGEFIKAGGSVFCLKQMYW